MIPVARKVWHPPSPADPVWWDRVFDALPGESLDALCATVVELLRGSEDEDWRLNVPHLFRRQAVRGQAEPARVYLAANAVLQACAVTGNFSSLALLVQDAASPGLEAATGGWRGQLNTIRRVVPAAVQAKLRTILAILPPDPVPGPPAVSP